MNIVHQGREHLAARVWSLSGRMSSDPNFLHAYNMEQEVGTIYQTSNPASIEILLHQVSIF